MSSQYKEIDLSQIKTISIEDRDSLVSKDEFKYPPDNLRLFTDLINSLPTTGKSGELKELIPIGSEVIRSGKKFILAMGAHPVKLGLSTWVIETMKLGYLSHLTLHGAGAIHDVEIATFGETSEDVGKNLKEGTFGLCEETSRIFNESLKNGAEEGLGCGEALGKYLDEKDAPDSELSLLYNAYINNIPATVHIAVGTDIVHQHPQASGADIGETTMRDFRIFAESVRGLINGGVFVNFGSAVIIPEVFLKALAMAFNVDGYSSDFTTANFDQIQHYRPTRNILERPGGRYFAFTGHHEFMLPLFIGSLLSKLEGKK